jgi:hypothetical protein
VLISSKGMVFFLNDWNPAGLSISGIQTIPLLEINTKYHGLLSRRAQLCNCG